MFGIDIKDLAELLPFIRDNLSSCAFLIIICLIIGFFIGKVINGARNNQKLRDRNDQIEKLEKEINDLKEEKRELTLRIQTQQELLGSGRSEMKGSPYIYLGDAAQRMMTSDSCVEFSALIELKLKNAQITEGNEIEPK